MMYWRIAFRVLAVSITVAILVAAWIAYGHADPGGGCGGAAGVDIPSNCGDPSYPYGPGYTPLITPDPLPYLPR